MANAVTVLGPLSGIAADAKQQEDHFTTIFVYASGANC
jgi:hypothetical protein